MSHDVAAAQDQELMGIRGQLAAERRRIEALEADLEREKSRAEQLRAKLDEFVSGRAKPFEELFQQARLTLRDITDGPEWPILCRIQTECRLRPVAAMSDGNLPALRRSWSSHQWLQEHLSVYRRVHEISRSNGIPSQEDLVLIGLYEALCEEDDRKRVDALIRLGAVVVDWAKLERTGWA